MEVRFKDFLLIAAFFLAVGVATFTFLVLYFQPGLLVAPTLDLIYSLN